MNNTQSSIPQVIHYCWFGKKRKPKLIKKCISSWLKYASKYKIIEWNEDNFDLSKAPQYVIDAYKCKKYAFVSDYVRFCVLNKYGGIYLDTDVELIKELNISDMNTPFFAMESSADINPGLIMVLHPNDPVCIYMLSSYEKATFYKDGPNITVCHRIAPFFEERGFVKKNVSQKCDGYYLYDSSYFSPYDFYEKTLVISSNTISIHWFKGSWISKKEKLVKYKIVRFLVKLKKALLR